MSLIEAYNLIATDCGKHLVCWKRVGRKGKKHAYMKAFASYDKAEQFFWELGPAIGFEYKFIAWPE